MAVVTQCAAEWWHNPRRNNPSGSVVAGVCGGRHGAVDVGGARGRLIRTRHVLKIKKNQWGNKLQSKGLALYLNECRSINLAKRLHEDLCGRSGRPMTWRERGWTAPSQLIQNRLLNITSCLTPTFVFSPGFSLWTVYGLAVLYFTIIMTSLFQNAMHHSCRLCTCAAQRWTLTLQVRQSWRETASKLTTSCSVFLLLLLLFIQASVEVNTSVKNSCRASVIWSDLNGRSLNPLTFILSNKRTSASFNQQFSNYWDLIIIT